MSETDDPLQDVSEILDDEALCKLVEALKAVKTTGWGSVVLVFTDGMVLSEYEAKPKWIRPNAKRLRK